MRRRAQGFSFRGFVALADLLFALSAGLLLLDPSLVNANKPPPTALPVSAPALAPVADQDHSADVQRIRTELKKAVALLDKLEADAPRIERSAQQILRSE